MIRLEEALNEIRAYSGPPLRIMEVCGTHTAAIMRSGIRSLLPEGIRLLSGPGCPVCVTPPDVIDRLAQLSREENTCVLSFGDLFRVPGSRGSLAEAKAVGGQVRMIYSPFDALSLAKSHPETRYVMAAVGFETTAPSFGLLAERALSEGVENLRFVSALRAVVPAVDGILSGPWASDGLICPGHVGAVTGTAPFAALCRKHQKPFVMAGFENAHIVGAIYAIVQMYKEGRSGMLNLYPEVVRPEGNEQALALLDHLFTLKTASWRGLGPIPDSGYALRGPYARLELGYDDSEFSEPSGCRCGEVLTGRISPPECPLYGSACAPEHPVGPCMVSQEGACGIWFSERRVNG